MSRPLILLGGLLPLALCGIAAAQSGTLISSLASDIEPALRVMRVDTSATAFELIPGVGLEVLLADVRCYDTWNGLLAAPSPCTQSDIDGLWMRMMVDTRGGMFERPGDNGESVACTGELLDGGQASLTIDLATLAEASGLTRAELGTKALSVAVMGPFIKPGRGPDLGGLRLVDSYRSWQDLAKQSLRPPDRPEGDPDAKLVWDERLRFEARRRGSDDLAGVREMLTTETPTWASGTRRVDAPFVGTVIEGAVSGDGVVLPLVPGGVVCTDFTQVVRARDASKTCIRGSFASSRPVYGHVCGWTAMARPLHDPTPFVTTWETDAFDDEWWESAAWAYDGTTPRFTSAGLKACSDAEEDDQGRFCRVSADPPWAPPQDLTTTSLTTHLRDRACPSVSGGLYPGQARLALTDDVADRALTILGHLAIGDSKALKKANKAYKKSGHSVADTMTQVEQALNACTASNAAAFTVSLAGAPDGAQCVEMSDWLEGGLVLSPELPLGINYVPLTAYYPDFPDEWFAYTGHCPAYRGSLGLDGGEARDACWFGHVFEAEEFAGVF